MKHQHILKDDAELSKVFPNGAKDFQVSERREAKNIKEILAKSKVRMLANDEDDPGSRPCVACEQAQPFFKHYFHYIYFFNINKKMEGLYQRYRKNISIYQVQVYEISLVKFCLIPCD